MSEEQLISILPSVILGLAGVIVTIIFAWSARKREHDKIMYELFRDFNSRYDELNDDLIRIMEPKDARQKGTLDYTWERDQAVMIDYFNLCAEEYFWYKNGRIDKKVWESWRIGMNYWYNHSSGILKDLWDKEIEKKSSPKSYYISKGDEFFKDNG